ncbi:tRNA glutamyl-Q(34) synthetase GluQRS [Sinisalibacter lacisalsi]|uniref:tRNA glutamyl-Q synthetase n=1 Tax=Sinisalibacter lacisalsi TaxID=1526570 RepID=A0ABQ1QN89_9RHOB|nr:tRNA glutamyl-Q(34) synthetase GluQRS [Sinisalibacter lacisalsi]GGD31918.1 tRNA glutamyl-Q synthetase [Sinisalibacter lacisalsi]
MITRFAPSPTGLLHLGHAFSALTAWDMARAEGGVFLLRIEDIDGPRCRPEFEHAIDDDLHWLGLDWPVPVMRQSERLPAYGDALARLAEMGLTYPCSCTRADIRAALAAPQEGASGPDGPPYPGTCRGRAMASHRPGDAIRLDIARAVAVTGPVRFEESGPGRAGRQAYRPDEMVANIGDVVLARKDIATSYHLSVVVDDAAQGITQVVRGEDLFAATPLHVLLQRLLEMPTPRYHHHRLIRDETGKRLAKRDDARAIRAYREAGATVASLRAMLGL